MLCRTIRLTEFISQIVIENEVTRVEEYRNQKNPVEAYVQLVSLVQLKNQMDRPNNTCTYPNHKNEISFQRYKFNAFEPNNAHKFILFFLKG